MDEVALLFWVMTLMGLFFVLWLLWGIVQELRAETQHLRKQKMSWAKRAELWVKEQEIEALWCHDCPMHRPDGCLADDCIKDIFPKLRELGN